MKYKIKSVGSSINLDLANLHMDKIIWSILQNMFLCIPQKNVNHDMRMSKELQLYVNYCE